MIGLPMPEAARAQSIITVVAVVGYFGDTIAANLLQKTFTKKMFGVICSCNKRIALQSKFIGLFLPKKDMPVAASPQRKSSGRIICVKLQKLLQQKMF